MISFCQRYFEQSGQRPWMSNSDCSTLKPYGTGVETTGSGSSNSKCVRKCGKQNADAHALSAKDTTVNWRIGPQCLLNFRFVGGDFPARDRLTQFRRDHMSNAIRSWLVWWSKLRIKTALLTPLLAQGGQQLHEFSLLSRFRLTQLRVESRSNTSRSYDNRLNALVLLCAVPKTRIVCTYVH